MSLKTKIVTVRCWRRPVMLDTGNPVTVDYGNGLTPLYRYGFTVDGEVVDSLVSPIMAVVSTLWNALAMPQPQPEAEITYRVEVPE